MLNGDFVSHILIFLIRIYQIIPFSSHMMCRHIPTCSNYMIEAIEMYGWRHGLCLGIKRIIKCRPHGTYGFDPVPKKEEKF